MAGVSYRSTTVQPQVSRCNSLSTADEASCPQIASIFNYQRRRFMAKSKRAQRLEDLAAEIRVCVKCPLHASRTCAVQGDGRLTARLMIIGEAPGKDEDLSG